MVILNAENAVASLPKNPQPYKGWVFDNQFLVIEDVVDLSKYTQSAMRRCLCKCLKCGKVLPLITIEQIHRGALRCPCSKKENLTFSKIKGRMLKFLVAERNKIRRDLLFPEDAEKVEEYDYIINFLEREDLQEYFHENC